MAEELTPHFLPRLYQEKFIDSFEDPLTKQRRFLIIWPRRSGKDLTAWVLMVRAAAKRIGNYFYLLPTYSQARKVIIDTVMGEEGLRFLDHINPKAVLDFNKSELKLTLRNGSVIQIAGSDSYNRLVGTNICGCIWSEWDLADPGSYTYLSPALRGNDGWAIFISTPRGKRSLFEMYQVAQNWPDEWFSERFHFLR